jgi:hypothetical protein
LPGILKNSAADKASAFPQGSGFSLFSAAATAAIRSGPSTPRLGQLAAFLLILSP